MASKIYKRSPFFYVGDKYKLLPQILPFFPTECARYIEPFAGGGSVFMNTNFHKVALNDLNKNVIDIHNLLLSYRNDSGAFFNRIENIVARYSLSNSSLGFEIDSALKAKFPKTYYAEINRTQFNHLKEHYNVSRERDVSQLYVLMIFGFNRMLRFNRKNEFNIPVGNVDYNSNVDQALRAYFGLTTGRDIATYNLPFEQFFSEIEPVEGDFVYLDPPYLITGSEYNKGWTRENELNLYKSLDWLNDHGVKFALSNVEVYGSLRNELLGSWMKDFNVMEIRSNYINYFDNSRKAIREVLVTNYAPSSN